jgi:hypothetical protein
LRYASRGKAKATPSRSVLGFARGRILDGHGEALPLQRGGRWRPVGQVREGENTEVDTHDDHNCRRHDLPPVDRFEESHRAQGYDTLALPWSVRCGSILHLSRSATAFLWSSSSVRAYRPPLMPMFLLFRVSCIIIRLHAAVRPRVTGAQHPGKHLVTREGPGHPSEARIPRVRSVALRPYRTG